MRILQAIYTPKNILMVEDKKLYIQGNAWGRESKDVYWPRDDLLADFEILNFVE